MSLILGVLTISIIVTVFYFFIFENIPISDTKWDYVRLFAYMSGFITIIWHYHYWVKSMKTHIKENKMKVRTKVNNVTENKLDDLSDKYEEMVIKSKYVFRFAFASYVICFPLSILFYILVFNLIPTDIPDYFETSVLIIFLGLLVPIYPTTKLFNVIKRNIVRIYKKVKEGTFRFNAWKKALIPLCSGVICSPLCILFYVPTFLIVPEDTALYKSASDILFYFGILISIFLSQLLYEFLKKKIIVIYKEVKRGTLRLEYHNPPLAEQYPEIYGDERNKIMPDKNDESDNSVDYELEVIENEIESSGALTLLMKDAISNQSAWGHYKSTKQSRRKIENLGEVLKVLDKCQEAIDISVKISKKDIELHELNIKRKATPIIAKLKHDVEIAKLEAERYKYEESISKSKQEIAKTSNSPPPVTPKSRQEIETEKRKKMEVEATRQELEVRGWRKELSDDSNFKDEDIETEIERRKRARGWIDSI